MGVLTSVCQSPSNEEMDKGRLGLNLWEFLRRVIKRWACDVLKIFIK